MMSRKLGRTLMPLLGMIVLAGACQLEPPEAVDTSDDTSAIVSAIADEPVDELAAEPITEVAASSPLAGCSRDKDCLDGKKSTYDWCSDGKCKHKERSKCGDDSSSCHSDDDCDDGDSGTKEWCYKKDCHYVDYDSGDCAGDDGGDHGGD